MAGEADVIKRGGPANREAYEAKHGKHCKGCGVWFAKRDNFYCSAECRKFASVKPVAFCCAYCGTPGSRDRSRIKNLSRIFCNPECQKQFQAARYWDYQSKGQRDQGLASRGKTKIARSKWAKQRRLERLQKSEGAKWWVECNKRLKKLTVSIEATDWERRCESACRSLKSRRDPTFKLQKHVPYSWGKTIRRNRQKLLIDSRTMEEKEWSMKINTATKSCKLRFLAKSKNAIGCFGTSIEVAAQGLLPFAE